MSEKWTFLRSLVRPIAKLFGALSTFRSSAVTGAAGTQDSSGATNTQSQWCLVGNIVSEHPYGEGGKDTKRGTKHFAPGTKVYCFPAQWGDGYENILVIGRHRGSHQFKTMIVRSAWVTNWRAKLVYNPEVLRRIQVAVRGDNRKWRAATWESKKDVEAYVKSLEKRERNKSIT